MTTLTVYNDDRPDQGEQFHDFDAICDQLEKIGVYIERWQATRELPPDAEQADVLAAYADSIKRLQQRFGFQSVDVVALRPEHPDKAAFRQKFLSEHEHADFEVRFFIDGKGLFYLHVDGKVYALLCEQGDLISVPAHMPHWFDMGENPDFKCIRLFTTPEGWVADFTGSPIADAFPKFDAFVAELTS
jgi:1,2-dihydroxy-3-keto-5-methylthiopentene dioxygenase